MRRTKQPRRTSRLVKLPNRSVVCIECAILCSVREKMRKVTAWLETMKCVVSLSARFRIMMARVSQKQALRRVVVSKMRLVVLSIQLYRCHCRKMLRRRLRRLI
eukprot:Rmarinus@m.15290